MALVTETIRVVTTGVNPQTQNFSVQVNTATGAGVSPLSVPLVGINSGSDSVTAFLDSHSLTSNQASVVWQAKNGAIATTPVTIKTYSNNGFTKGYAGLQTSASDQGRTAFPYTTVANSLVFNQVVANYPINGFTAINNVGVGGGYKLNPMVAVEQTNTGTYASNLVINGTAGNNSSGSFPGFVLDCTTTLVVATPGTYTFYMNYANVSSCALYIGGGATFSSVSFNGGNLSGSGTTLFPSTGPSTGYPLACCATNPSSASQPSTVSSYITFPVAGIYPIEAYYNQIFSCQFSFNHNSFWQLTYLSGTQNQNVGIGSSGIGFQSFPVAQAIAPPTGATPTGDLRLTPTGGSAGLKIQGQSDTLTLTIQNVPYTSINYMPILEGTAGALFVYNSGTAFNFQTYNGNAVDPTAAASSVFSITGSNSAVNGLFTVTPQSGAFKLNYNGGAFAFAVPGSQIATSDLTLTADDIAWYLGSNKSFDLFTPVGGAGGTAFSIAVDYMTKPTVKSVAPASLQANGANQALTINLSKPMSPQQQGLYGTGNTVVPSASITGGATITSPLTPVLDSAGFLQGWSTNVNVPISSTNGSLTLSMTVTGTLTYLSGTNFVTSTVTYITGAVATIPTVGDQYVPPVAVSLTVVPGNTSTGTTQTLTGTVYTFDNSTLTLQFQRKSIAAGSSAINIGAGTLTNSFTSTIGGKTAYNKTFTLTGFVPIAQAAGSTVQNFGFVATDTVSNLNVTYFSTTNYTFPAIAGGGGGGGGGGGCPAVEMFVNDTLQVFDVFVGDELSTLAGEYAEYLDNPITTEPRKVQQLEYSTEFCYQFTAENGAEVVISATTPVPTREAIAALNAGVDPLIVPQLAHQISAGTHVITDVGNGTEWSLLTECFPVGMRRVARLYCGGRNFAAGSKPGKYIYTHNVQIVK